MLNSKLLLTELFLLLFCCIFLHDNLGCNLIIMEHGWGNSQFYMSRGLKVSRAPIKWEYIKKYQPEIFEKCPRHTEKYNKRCKIIRLLSFMCVKICMDKKQIIPYAGWLIVCVYYVNDEKIFFLFTKKEKFYFSAPMFACFFFG